MAYPNQKILYEMKFGVRFDREFSNSAVMAPPYANALPHLDVLWQAIQKEIKKGFYTVADAPTAFPCSINAVGAVVKKGKCRVATGADGPHDALDPEGRPLSVNGAHPSPDAELEDMKWLTISHSLNMSEILYSLFELLSQELPAERLELLRPTVWAVDASSYFRRIPTCNRDKPRQSLLFPAPDGPKILNSDTMIFGMSEAPQKSQEIAYVTDDMQRIGTREWWDRVRKIAEGKLPAPTELRQAAQGVCPPELAAWIDSRAVELGIDQADTMPTLQYIDDRKGGAMGNTAMVAGWLVAVDNSQPHHLDFPLEASKTQGGTTSSHICDTHVCLNTPNLPTL